MFELQRNKRKRVGMRQFKCWIYLSWTKHLPWTALDEWIYYKKGKLFPLCPPRCQRWKYGVNCIYYESLHFFSGYLTVCGDLLYIHFFILQFKYMKFIYSLLHFHLSRVYANCTSPIMHLICPPKFCVSIVFNFSWDGSNTLASEQQTYFRSSLLSFSEGEKRRPEIRLLFAG